MYEEDLNIFPFEETFQITTFPYCIVRMHEITIPKRQKQIYTRENFHFINFYITRTCVFTSTLQKYPSNTEQNFIRPRY